MVDCYCFQWFEIINYRITAVTYTGVCLLVLCLIPISALLFPAAGSEGGFLRGVGCGGERGREDETDVVVGGSQSTTKYNDNVLALLSMCSG